jgi:hypothetical protein
MNYSEVLALLCFPLLEKGNVKNSFVEKERHIFYSRHPIPLRLSSRSMKEQVLKPSLHGPVDEKSPYPFRGNPEFDPLEND